MRNQDSTDDDLMPRDPTRVAVIQHSATTDVDKNLTTLALLSREAAAAGASLITWPEAFAYLGRHEGKRALLESLAAPGPILTFCQDLAREMGTDLLLGGFHEKVAGDPSRCYNTSVYLDHEGHILATYRKIHLFDVDIPDGPRLMESRHTAPGDQAVVVTGKPGVLGLSICYDVRFPALYQRLVSLGAMAITVPSAFTQSTGAAHWHALLKARAIECQCYIIAPAQYGEHSARRASYGHSLIVDPWGETLAEIPDGDGYAIATLDPKRVQDVRQQIPSLANQRTFSS